jgi:hypothetical protein
MSSDTFVFSKLNFNGDERKRPRSRKTNKQTIPTPRKTNGMSFIATKKVIESPDFVPEKFVSTPLGFITKTLFGKGTPAKLVDPHYLRKFTQSVERQTRNLFPENQRVADYVLENFLLIPCNVPFRFGVLFNLKFRRMFQCLDLQRWKELLDILETNGFLKIEKDLTSFLVDPSLDSIDSSATPQTQASDYSSIETFFDNYTTSKSTTPSPSHSFTPPQTPTKPVEPVRLAPSRKKNETIFSASFLESTSLDAIDMADRFDTLNLNTNCKSQIETLYENDGSLIYAKLATLPINVPLRWGCVYNKSVRLRSKSQTKLKIIISTLDQWRKLKGILKSFGYLDDKSVINCAILINKRTT